MSIKEESNEEWHRIIIVSIFLIIIIMIIVFVITIIVTGIITFLLSYSLIKSMPPQSEENFLFIVTTVTFEPE